MDFIDFEATVVSDNEVGSEDEVSNVDSLKSFIDDKTKFKVDRTSYYRFENASKSVEVTLAEEFNESMRAISIFCETSEEEDEVDA